MLNLGNLLMLLLATALLGVGGPKALKRVETESAKMAVEAHKSGYLSIQGYHRRLMNGK